MFNLYLENYPEPGDVLVHNTLSDGFAVVDQATFAALNASLGDTPLTDEQRALLDDPDLSDPDVGIVVASRTGEEEEFRQWFERGRRKDVLDVLVSVNLACNFDCPYCSQATILDGSVMKPVVAAQTAAWLATRAQEGGVSAIKLVFCGGEPLLHPDRIVDIVRQLRAEPAARGLPVSFGLITNGYFLTDEIVDRLVAEGLTKAQVTLDGDERTHSLTRVSKKGEDTFARIFENALAASRKIRISINGNYTPTTAHAFQPLVEKLAAAGLPSGSGVRLTPALEGLASQAGAAGGACTWSQADTRLHVAMQDEILRNGFSAAPLNVVGPCEFHDHHAFAIDPDGTIYKCPGFLGHPEWSIGHVTTGLTERYQSMLASTPQDSCDGCAHRPNCGGGCIAAEWLRTGQQAGVNCEHDYFELVRDQALVREYLLASHDSREAAVAALGRQDPPATGSRARRSEALRVL